MSRCVLQRWVQELPLMQQTVLLTAIRGADGVEKTHPSKYVLRWLRRCILLSAFDDCILHDPHDERGGNFTGPIPRELTLEQLFTKTLKRVDELPHHFLMHVIHAAEILGYKHPDMEIRHGWCGFYCDAVRGLHLVPEGERDMDKRLGDDQRNWQLVGGEALDQGRQRVPVPREMDP